MNYIEVIEARKSVRDYREKEAETQVTEEIRNFHDREAKRLVPEIETQLLVFGAEAKAALEGAAGYSDFLIGAPGYLVLLSKKHPHAGENAGFVMEDVILKLTDLGLGTCWITFTDSEKVKTALGIDSVLDVAAIAAFGRAKRARKRIHLNIVSMSNIDIKAKKQFADPKRSVDDMVYLKTYGNKDGVDEHIGFYGNLLWEALYGASLSPSYLNRQPYDFVIGSGKAALIEKDDAFTGKIDGDLGLGIAMLHFAGAASDFSADVKWSLDVADEGLELPEGCTLRAVCEI